MSWFVCPLMADAAGLSYLYPAHIIPRPNLCAVWAALPHWSFAASPVRQLSWSRLCGLTALALDSWRLTLPAQPPVQESLLRIMDMQNHFPRELQDEILRRVDSLLPPFVTIAESSNFPMNLTRWDAISEAAQFLAAAAACVEPLVGRSSSRRSTRTTASARKEGSSRQDRSRSASSPSRSRFAC